MSDNARVLMQTAIVATLIALVITVAMLGEKWKHEERLKALENENAHPGIWRK